MRDAVESVEDNTFEIRDITPDRMSEYQQLMQGAIDRKDIDIGINFSEGEARHEIFGSVPPQGIFIGGGLVGVIHFTSTKGKTLCADVGYILEPRYRGKNIMTFALNRALHKMYDRFDRFEAAVLPGNTESERVLEKNGFKFNGRWREVFDEPCRIFEHAIREAQQTSS